MPVTTDNVNVNGNLAVSGETNTKTLKVNGTAGMTKVVPFWAYTDESMTTKVRVLLNFSNGLFTGAILEVDS